VGSRTCGHFRAWRGTPGRLASTRPQLREGDAARKLASEKRCEFRIADHD